MKESQNSGCPAPFALKRRRTILACSHCRKRKIRCITTEQPPTNPCARCKKRNLCCEYVAAPDPEQEHSPPPRPQSLPFPGSTTKDSADESASARWMAWAPPLTAPDLSRSLKTESTVAQPMPSPSGYAQRPAPPTASSRGALNSSSLLASIQPSLHAYSQTSALALAESRHGCIGHYSSIYKHGGSRSTFQYDSPLAKPLQLPTSMFDDEYEAHAPAPRLYLDPQRPSSTRLSLAEDAEHPSLGYSLDLELQLFGDPFPECEWSQSDSGSSYSSSN
ncbi:hypothetical protein FB451DRAFT_1215760 [Mycena latifolia]|nr:hypothetical protein FB451DRAFT_1215760 [Mycena latifolia]